MPAATISGVAAFGDPIIRKWAAIFAAEFKKGGASVVADSIAKEQKARETNTESLNDASQALNRYLTASKKVSNGTFQQAQNIKRATEIQTNAFETLSQDTSDLGKKYQDIAKLHKAGIISEEDAFKRQDKLNKQVADGTVKLVSALDKAKSGLKTVVKDLFNFRTASALLTKAVYQGANDFRASMKYGTDTSRGVMENMTKALELGIDPAVLSEIGASTRQVQNVMGGAGKWADKLVGVQKSLFMRVGDLESTARLTANTLMTLGVAGIKPTTDILMDSAGHLGKLGVTFDKIQKTTGATFEESAQMMREFAEDSALRFKLTAAATSEERKQILLGVAKRHEELAALGFTTEQAKRAGHALDAIAGKGPRERFKEAAKLQATMGAMGMGQQGAIAAQIMRKGRRATAGEQAQLAKIMGKVNDKMAKSTTGSFADEFMMSTLAEKTNFQEYLGPDSPFNTTLAEGLKSNPKNADNIKTLADNSTVQAKAIKDGVYYSSWIAANLHHSPQLSAILGALSASGPIVTAILGAAGAGKVLGVAGKGAMGARGWLGKIAGKVPGVGGKLAGGVLGAGAGMAALGVTGAGVVGGLIGTALDKAWDNTAAKEGFGNFVGNIVDNVGAFFGSDEAQKRLGINEKLKEQQDMLEADKRAKEMQAQQAEPGAGRPDQQEKLAQGVNGVQTAASETAAHSKKSVDIQHQMLDIQKQNLDATQRIARKVGAGGEASKSPLLGTMK